MVRAILMATAMLAVAGCGGGGSGGGDSGVVVPPPPPPAPAPTPTPVPTPAPTPPPTGALNYDAAASYAIANGSRAVLILRAGQIMLERYGNGGGAAVAEQLASGTKSFTCLLAAAAEDDGFLAIEERVGAVLPPWGPNGTAPQLALKQQIRGIDLIGLTSGLTSSGSFGGELNSIDSYQQAFTQPSRAAPDTATIYGPNGFQAFSAWFELKTGGRYNADGSITGGRDGVDYLKTRVFDRIGLVVDGWRRDIKGKPNFGGGASMTATSWGRFGQLMEQSGLWNGQQIVSAARLQRCVTYRSGAFQGYGLGWWLNRSVGNSYQPGRDFLPFQGAVAASWQAGGRAAPSAPEDMYSAAGAGEMRLYVVPSQDLVIVRMAGPEEEDRFFQLLYGTGA